MIKKIPGIGESKFKSLKRQNNDKVMKYNIKIKYLEKVKI